MSWLRSCCDLLCRLAMTTCWLACRGPLWPMARYWARPRKHSSRYALIMALTSHHLACPIPSVQSGHEWLHIDLIIAPLV